MRIAFQMDPPESLELASDTSFALALAAAARGYELFWYEPRSLALVDWVVHAQLHGLRAESAPERMVSTAARTVPLAEMDIVLMRQNPPFDMDYLHATWLLEYLPPPTLVVHDPRAVRDAPEKLLRGALSSYTPPTLISSNIEAIEKFAAAQAHGVVLKPLYGYGGHGIKHVAHGENVAPHLAQWSAHWQGAPLVQAYLPQVLHEDRRVFVINGRAVGAIGRIPAQGEFRANLRTGARAEKAEPSALEEEVAQLVGEVLGADKIIFAGLDFIGSYLTEINLTSPTGLRSLLSVCGIDGAALFWDAVESLHARRRA